MCYETDIIFIANSPLFLPIPVFSRKWNREIKSDSVRLQKELCALHRYVDSVIKSDTILQQRFHCLGAGLTK